MKKIYLLSTALIISAASFAQTGPVPGGDMENWRNTTSGSTHPIAIQAPTGWYGVDSLIIADGQTYGPLAGLTSASADFHRQLFEESTITHGGNHSAKVITVNDSLLGEFPGFLANAKANVSIGFSLPPTISPPTYTGGTAVTQRITSVSAWVEYLPGFDSGTHTTGADTGYLLVQAMAPIHGYDSVIGTGYLLIPPHSSFTQITANLTYIDTLDDIDTVRILFASSGGARKALDSSTLYVDDVTMVGVPYSVNAVASVAAQSNLVKVYPNPVSNTLYFDSRQTGLTCTMYSVSGREVANNKLTGNGAVDVSYLPAGLYFYAITDEQGNTVQRGKVSVTR